MNREARCSRPSDWLQLLRLPNLLTVPGDPLAGYLLAGGMFDGRWWLPLLAAVLFYSAGLLLNDWTDIEEDRTTRPERPLPAGRVPRRHVLLAAILAAGTGILLAFLASPPCGVVAVLLAACVALYNLWARRWLAAGWLVMGLCRGLSVMLGAGMVIPAVSATPALLAAAGTMLYIVALTAFADVENQRGRVSFIRRWMPAGVLALVAIGAYWLQRDELRALYTWIAPIPFLIAGHVALTTAGEQEPAAVQRGIGRLVRNLLPLQAMLAAAAPTGNIAACILLALWPLSTLFSRRYASS